MNVFASSKQSLAIKIKGTMWCYGGSTVFKAIHIIQCGTKNGNVDNGMVLMLNGNGFRKSLFHVSTCGYFSFYGKEGVIMCLSTSTRP